MGIPVSDRDSRREVKMEKRNLTLLTDLYELTMMNGYFNEGYKDQIAVFDIFFRQHDLITYSLAAGLEQAIDYVENLRFGKEEIEYLKNKLVEASRRIQELEGENLIWTQRCSRAEGKLNRAKNIIAMLTGREEW